MSMKKMFDICRNKIFQEKIRQFWFKNRNFRFPKIIFLGDTFLDCTTKIDFSLPDYLHYQWELNFRSRFTITSKRLFYQND